MAASLPGSVVVVAATLAVATAVRMLLAVPPGAAETPRTVVATEVPVEVAVSALPVLPAVTVVTAMFTVAATEIVAATREPVFPVSAPPP